MLSIVATVAAIAKTGVDVYPILEELVDGFKPGAPKPTADDFARWAAIESANSAVIQRPLPEEQP